MSLLMYILADSLLFSVNNILAGLWFNCISSVENKLMGPSLFSFIISIIFFLG